MNDAEDEPEGVRAKSPAGMSNKEWNGLIWPDKCTAICYGYKF